MSLSPNKPVLKLDWCSYEAAKWAVEHWHYSKVMPAGKLVKIGVWEDGQFIGAVLFGSGTAPQAGRPYGLDSFGICELVRVALTIHISPVSSIIAHSIRMLRRQSPGIRMIVSYADPEHGHIGTIYQAGGWYYVGTSEAKWRANGIHNRVFGTSITRAKRVLGDSVIIKWEQPKHKYLYPLDAAMRAQIEPLRKPYPKRGSGETDSAPCTNGETGGASPTDPLCVEAGLYNASAQESD